MYDERLAAEVLNVLNNAYPDRVDLEEVKATLPANVRPTHRSLFDGTLQGIELTNRPAYSFQGHPEASPGPREMAYLFDKFVAMMDKRQKA